MSSVVHHGILSTLHSEQSRAEQAATCQRRLEAILPGARIASSESQAGCKPFHCPPNESHSIHRTLGNEEKQQPRAQGLRREQLTVSRASSRAANDRRRPFTSLAAAALSSSTRRVSEKERRSVCMNSTCRHLSKLVSEKLHC